jgi:tetratricopeptide (TPR) repeat protein
MSRSNIETDYLDIAEKLFENVVSERDLPAITPQLSPLSEDILHKLARHAEKAGLSEPRRGWAITTVGDYTAIFQGCSLFLRSVAAWYLGRACNQWTRPKLVAEAIGRARDGFLELDETGWLAACDWQLNALAWTKPDLNRAARELKQALERLQNAGFHDFVPQCRLSLAYALILTGKIDEAQGIILANEAAYMAQEDILNQARCWRMEASRLRRTSKFDEAIDLLRKANSVFIDKKALLDEASVNYQLGLIHLLRTDDLAVALSHFEQAAQIFARADLDLWQAACTTNIGAIYSQYGDLSKAEESYRDARAVFIEHDVLGLLADNLNDSGKLNTLRGFPRVAVEEFKQAEELYRKLGTTLPNAILNINIGEVYGQMGRYQDALHYLEQAADYLKHFDNPLRIGTCENYTAVIWWRLGNHSLAHEHLDKATGHYKEAKQIAYLSLVNNFRASLFFEQGELDKAIECLKDSLQIAETHGIRPHAALARRLLGEAYLLAGEYEDSRDHLEHALRDFTIMGMTMERAATQISLGAYYTQVSNLDRARSAFVSALRTSKGSFPEIDWRARLGKARMAEARGDIKAALSEYRWGDRALFKVRSNFWQPALAGSYLQSPSLVYDRAVTLAAKSDRSSDVVQFIENNKAITLLRQLAASRIPTEDIGTQELNDLKAEINWLQSQLRISYDRANPITSAIRSRQLHTHLIDKVKQYDERVARLERKGFSDQASAAFPQEFSLSALRELLDRSIGKSWVALDYYLVDDQLVIGMVTPDSCRSLSSSISPRVKLALDECHKARRNASSFEKSDLKVLGDFLIPLSVTEILSPETCLLIVPHKNLHGLPWGAIQPGSFPHPLACGCIPSVIPSLHSLAMLYERNSSYTDPDRDNGLLVGLSKFREAHQELPFVKAEIDAINARLGSHGCTLRDNDASWENLQALIDPGDSKSSGSLSRFAWLHVASHVLSDVRTGRLSGVALWDGDIWLDQLLDLAPLPRMVTFSACNSIYSVIYQGDEHVGLFTTCMTAGAQSIVGSIRPIQDRLANEFMIDFYDHYLDGMQPSQAVVQTQRQLIAQGADTSNWASFVSVGVP